MHSRYSPIGGQTAAVTVSIGSGAGRVAFANNLRGLAALSVVAAHYLGVFWVARGIAASQVNAAVLPHDQFPTPVYVQWFVSTPLVNWGALGVAVFFLISGFVVPFSFDRQTGPRFLVGRAFRVVPTYVVGFSLTLLAIWVASVEFDLPWPHALRAVLIQYLPGIRDIVWSDMIDPVVWTLEIEIKFYLLCAVLAAFFRRRALLPLFVPLALCAFMLLERQFNTHPPTYRNYAQTLPFALAQASQYIIFMFIGVAFHYLHRQRLSARVVLPTVAGTFALFVWLWLGDPSKSPHELWSYGLAVLIFGICLLMPRLVSNSRVLSFFADISYPLYVTHCAVGYVALQFVVRAGWPSWLSILAVFGGVVLMATAIHLLVEVPSHRLGQRLSRRPGAAVNLVGTAKPGTEIT